MENIKKAERGRKVSQIETELVRALEGAVSVGLTSANVDEYPHEYEDLYAAAYHFIEKVALRKHRAGLENCGIDPAEVASVVTEELFWRKLDYIMQSDNPVNCRGLIVNTVMLRSRDRVRSEKRAQNDVPANALKEGAAEQASAVANVHMTEVGWNLVASNMNLEAEAIAHEECLMIMDALKRNGNAFEVVSFLATKVVGYKASDLAVDLIACGNEAVYASVLQQTAELFGVDDGYFADAAFRRENAELKYHEVKKLSAEISRGSDRAKNKVRNLMVR